ncbi:MAG: SLC13 family permease [Bacteroidota bacterium]|nr:SLC13 family permease [Bacteroidota bacterium]
MSSFIVLATIVSLIVALYSSTVKPSILFLIAVSVFLISGILTPEDILKGLANKQVIVIFLLLILAAGFKKEFGHGFFNYLFKPDLLPKQFLLRLMLFVSSCSAFINNTPIVAFMTPYVKEWVDRKGFSASKFMIPLAFATVLGGMITVVGTSTNLLLNGLIAESGLKLLGYKDFLFLGLIVTVLGLIYLYTIGYFLLPDKKSPIQEMKEHLNEYVVETMVEPSSILIGEHIKTRLRNLKDIYLFEVVRKGQSIFPVSPEEVVEEGDLLYFSGRTGAIGQLVKEIKGLTLPDTTTLNRYRHHHCIEAIIPANSHLIGKKVRESNFRQQYNASIIALHREGKRMAGPVGETILDAGDLVLLLGGDNMHNYQSDLFLIRHHDIKMVKTKKTFLNKLAPFVALILLILGITRTMDLFIATSLAILVFVVIKTLRFKDLKNAFDFDLAVLLVASLAIGLAIFKSGAGQWVATEVLRISGTNPVAAISLLFAVTLLITAVISNPATVAIVFPVAVSLSGQLHISNTPVFVAIAFAASCTFMTPFGYQCNLMVYGPGNYSFKDFFKIGFPLTLIYAAACIIFISWYYNL